MPDPRPQSLKWRRRGAYVEALTPLLRLSIFRSHFGKFHVEVYRRLSARDGSDRLRIPQSFEGAYDTLAEAKESLARFASEAPAVLAALAQAHEKDLAQEWCYLVVRRDPPTRRVRW